MKPEKPSSSISSLANILKEELSRSGNSFSQELFRYIDAKGMKDVEVYTRAHISRKLFSKIRKWDYRPRRETIIALALALELDYGETIHLLSFAGYTLSAAPSMPFDIIITRAIHDRTYDINEVNELLYLYDLPLLGD